MWKYRVRFSNPHPNGDCVRLDGLLHSIKWKRWLPLFYLNRFLKFRYKNFKSRIHFIFLSFFGYTTIKKRQKYNCREKLNLGLFLHSLSDSKGTTLSTRTREVGVYAIRIDNLPAEYGMKAWFEMEFFLWLEKGKLVWDLWKNDYLFLN